ncbi:hypothetical protein H6F43_04280 [Leptolyngbya sp. FACHB-36]|uniref:hypothetical protein n=1 Tax=Leptolyngbya sp. FACHB-36 TaxID=2692808 RepID=UPI00168134B5|nr:hypothetical protein [Leptolyngbya sp. FACHB-36]MBD2019401.1 hypothetical protein [Leptolyngbya sp. FACHB-36]
MIATVIDLLDTLDRADLSSLDKEIAFAIRFHCRTLRDQLAAPDVAPNVEPCELRDLLEMVLKRSNL